MKTLSNPSWIAADVINAEAYCDYPPAFINVIRHQLRAKLDYYRPQVSIIIAARNEEVNIVKCLYYLAKTETKYSFEILVVNNDSTDQTQQALDDIGVRSLLQKVPGSGPSRALGMREARGKYVLLADADCLYPRDWVQIMTGTLETEGTSCVYGNYSFIGSADLRRYKLWIHEQLRAVVARFRHIKTPYLNAYGMSMGFPKELGLKAAVVQHAGSGFDARICFDLMQMGKVKWVKAHKARIWREPHGISYARVSQREAALKRLTNEILKFAEYFRIRPAYHSRTIQKSEGNLQANWYQLKGKFKLASFFSIFW